MDTDTRSTSDDDYLIFGDIYGDTEYCLRSSVTDGHLSYSVEIISGDRICRFFDISRDRDTAHFLYRALWEGKVSPLTAPEILDDLMEAL